MDKCLNIYIYIFLRIPLLLRFKGNNQKENQHFGGGGKGRLLEKDEPPMQKSMSHVAPKVQLQLSLEPRHCNRLGCLWKNRC